MAGDEDVTLGEVSRKLDDFRHEVRESLNRSVSRGEYEEYRKANGERLGAVEKNVTRIDTALTTINRIAWTAIVIPILVAVLTAIIIAAIGIGGKP